MARNFLFPTAVIGIYCRRATHSFYFGPFGVSGGFAAFVLLVIQWVDSGVASRSKRYPAFTDGSAGIFPSVSSSV